MTTGLIDINDAGIGQYINGRLIGSSPAYAVLRDGVLLLGNEAKGNARLSPRWTNTRFWNQLNSDPIANGTKSIRHHADIAFAHLEQIWQEMVAMDTQLDEVIMTVPSFYENKALGLLLGMAKEASIPVKAIFDPGLLAVSEQATTPRSLYLDISMHRITLDCYDLDKELKRVETKTIADTGLFTLWDRWANVVASQFIQSSRFDPMHQAESEQVLYDQLPSWIEKTTKDSTFDIEFGSAKHSVAVSSEKLLVACRSIYSSIKQAVEQAKSQESQTTLYVSHRYSGFPNFTNILEELKDINLVMLDSTATSRSYQHIWRGLKPTSNSVNYITSLPRTGKAELSKPSAQKTKDLVPPTPTHILTENIAQLIGTADLNIVLEKKDSAKKSTNPDFTISKTSDGLLLSLSNDLVLLNNQKPKRPTILKLGDQISINTYLATMIKVNS